MIAGRRRVLKCGVLKCGFSSIEAWMGSTNACLQRDTCRTSRRWGFNTRNAEVRDLGYVVSSVGSTKVGDLARR
jgi:hypothetical protein